MTWKTALLTALKERCGRDLFRAVFVATPAALICSFEKGAGTGLLLAAGIGAAVYAIDIVDAARQARKHDRLEASRVSD